MEPQEIQNAISGITERNKKVELDKQWETSLTRRLFISAVTYAAAAIWLMLIKDANFWLKAFVPVAGYVLSTLSLPPLKKWWIKNQK